MSAVELRPLDLLIGTWRGEGEGFYPTIEPFGYSEEITFSAIATKPFLVYSQRTRHRAEQRPLHAESGFWRWVVDRAGVEGGGVELVLAHPNGLTEILEGDRHDVAGGFDLELRSTNVGRASTAKVVTATSRRFELRGDVLRYTMAMAAVGVGLEGHLEAELHRS